MNNDTEHFRPKWAKFFLWGLGYSAGIGFALEMILIFSTSLIMGTTYDILSYAAYIIGACCGFTLSWHIYASARYAAYKSRRTTPTHNSFPPEKAEGTPLEDKF